MRSTKTTFWPLGSSHSSSRLDWKCVQDVPAAVKTGSDPGSPLKLSYSELPDRRRSGQMRGSGQIQLADMFSLEHMVFVHFLCRHFEVKRLHIQFRFLVSLETSGGQAARDLYLHMVAVGCGWIIVAPYDVGSRYRDSGHRGGLNTATEGQLSLVIRLPLTGCLVGLLCPSCPPPLLPFSLTFEWLC